MICSSKENFVQELANPNTHILKELETYYINIGIIVFHTTSFLLKNESTRFKIYSIFSPLEATINKKLFRILKTNFSTFKCAKLNKSCNKY